jgi:hypothetical protein
MNFAENNLLRVGRELARAPGESVSKLTAYLRS